ncbi:hypothetical protein THAOC_15564 [Thalassiosira oceanica]|uniref:Uncharacterized protein n=1 Tax=Thalassiosira oceanica TaxID=159749 RepID=K0SRW1_THAOC|nr:hypothetical protein THAOC_15564 [Thalassiosira oceanica]|eukprot:EJK63761.1 hypothetical protein THAOC_15564 [Thalassiosira oceanica]
MKAELEGLGRLRMPPALTWSEFRVLVEAGRNDGDSSVCSISESEGEYGDESIGNRSGWRSDGSKQMMSWPGKQRECTDDDEHSRGRFGDSIGYGANDESTRSQREYSVDDASGMQM